MNREKERIPTKKEKLRPLELIGFSAVLAIFSGLVVLLTTRSYDFLAPISSILVFIISLLFLALIGLAVKPNPEDIAAKEELEETELEDRD